MITINYFSHRRKGIDKYWQITNYYLNKIKPENKKKIKLNILATKEYDWSSSLKDIDHDVYYFPDVDVNYMQKISTAVTTSEKYAVKLDEDCFISNHIWDYIIENINVLDDEDNFILTPMFSNGVPLTDRFVESFILDEGVKKTIYDSYLNREMPNGLWGVDYTPLNEFTVGATEWNSQKYFEGVSRLNTYLKGIHPIRICAEAQVAMNDYIVDNLERLFEKNNYSIKKFTEPYYTTNAFIIKTEDWINLLNMGAHDSFDEIQLNLYREKYNKNFLYIENGFSIHTIYNTMYGNKNVWNIGLENGQEYEYEFVNSILNKLK